MRYEVIYESSSKKNKSIIIYAISVVDMYEQVEALEDFIRVVYFY